MKVHRILSFVMVPILAFSIFGCEREQENVVEENETLIIEKNDDTESNDISVTEDESSVSESLPIESETSETTEETNIPYSEGLSYMSLGDGTAYVVGMGTCTDSIVSIPPVTPDGDTVVKVAGGFGSIGDGYEIDTFYECQTITSIVIPDTVTAIGNAAFSGCRNLTSVVIPDSVVSIGNGAFSGCSNLSSINIPYGVEVISQSVFHECSSLTNIVIPDSVTVIDTTAFANCNSLTSVQLSANLVSLGTSSFKNCTNLTNIVIPDSVTMIAAGVFEGCSNLTDVTIPTGCTTFGTIIFLDCNSLQTVNGISMLEWAESLDLSSYTVARGIGFDNLCSLESLYSSSDSNSMAEYFVEIITDTAIR